MFYQTRLSTSSGRDRLDVFYQLGQDTESIEATGTPTVAQMETF